MKQELKEIVGYLPYGVKVKIVDKIRNYKVGSVKVLSSQLFWDYSRTKRVIIKPILRPLSDLTKEITVNGETFVTTDKYWRMNSLMYHMNQFDKWDKPSSYLNSVAPYGLVVYLMSLHFDVFGLIEQNKAIDINTLEG